MERAAMSNTAPTARKWVTDIFLAERYSVSRATIWRWAKIGKLPPPQKIGENSTRWELGEADAYVLGDNAA
jgi:predicted DNA-binding transcriptional regulator AlpA